MRFEELFPRCWPHVRPLLHRTRHPGLLLIAVDSVDARVSPPVSVPCSRSLPSVAIVGRHPRCDLVLPRRSEASLRHLAVLASPGASAGIEARIVDLRTGVGFGDERGIPHASMATEAPMFLSIGRQALFGFATGEERQWPVEARQVWATLDHGDSSTGVPTALIAPAKRTALLGQITVTASAGGRFERQVLTLDQRAASGGVLIGRYERCDLAMASADGMSRVHLLVIAIGRHLYAVDTASTHSTFVSGRGRVTQRVTRLEPGLQLMLGHRGAHLTWDPTTVTPLHARPL